MPELPEVETTRRGIEPHLRGRTIAAVTVRQPKLRWPVPAELPQRLVGQRIERVERRAKYLLLPFPASVTKRDQQGGALLLHLGMSGSLRIIDAAEPPMAHDHLDIALDSGQALRLTDPRRFGAALWIEDEPLAHPLLAALGPEPLSDAFDGDYLFERSRGRSAPIKTFLMDGHVVVGVGNIYANEALFAAGIRPDRAAGRVSRERYGRLADAVKRILAHAIQRGGTTLRDFVGGDGKPGYFQQELSAYGRGGQPCKVCRTELIEVRLGQRSTVYCRVCQR